MKKKIVFLIVAMVLVAGAYSVYAYLYRDHRDIESEVAVKALDADELQQLFQNNPSNELLNKTLDVSGTVSQVDQNTVTLDEKVHCSFEHNPGALAVGDEVKVKGRCVGYDDLFEVVKLDQSTLIHK